MTDDPRLSEGYLWAKCCRPQPGDAITGYFSLDDVIKVHRSDCSNLQKADPARLVQLVWNDIVAGGEFVPDSDIDSLDDIDFAILSHHNSMGIDYSLMVASSLQLDRQDVFQRHRRLREMSLLERVDPVMVQYRKGIVDNKWIKHRNHTYYAITSKGVAYLEYFRKRSL
jgi:hypothetical protein